MQITINQRSPVSRPRAYCEECAKRSFSGHVKNVDVNTQADWEEITDIFHDDLCEHLDALVGKPFDAAAKTTKTIEELRTLIRTTMLVIERSDTEGIEETVAPVRAALAERGLGPGCHVGKGLTITPDEVVEWYAGQLLAIVDAKSWFAMNSLINCLDKFCPAIPPT